jgi:hypothetical protein
MSCNKYRSCSGNCFYLAVGRVTSTEVTEVIPSKHCTVINNGLFAVNMPSVGTGTLPVQLEFACDCPCNGETYPLYDPVTGLQVTAAQFFAGSTYLISWDKFSRKFYVHTPLVAGA